MSRLIINIVHNGDGRLDFGVQSDNADQVVGVLQHQLANATRELDGLKPQVESIGGFQQQLAERDETISRLNSEVFDLTSKLEQAKAKRPARRRR